MLEHPPARCAESPSGHGARLGSRRRDEPAHRGELAASIDELVRKNRDALARVSELCAANAVLKRALDAQARRQESVMRELELAAERAGDQPLARLIRRAAAAPATVASAGTAPCADPAALGCAAHGAPDCAPCRALAASLPPLSGREREVLRLLTEGGRSPCIAAQLGISPATVEVHRRNIMRKLGLHGVAALTKYAVRAGLTSL